jgi:hypothetical protein
MGDRNLIDQRIESARSLVNEAGSMLSSEHKTLAWVAIDLTEALVLQIRDADDSQWQFKESMESALSDLGVILNGIDFSENGRRR